MAQYNGYTAIPHGSYDEWRSATLGNGYDYDRYYADQCWDYVQECYAQYGLTLYTRAGGGVAADCWRISRQANSRTPFISIEGVTNIKRGDIIVWNSSSSSTTGHIAFADEDYRGSRIWTLGQSPSTYGMWGGVHRQELGLGTFLGIFRNTLWQGSPTPPEPEYNKGKYNFVLFNRRKRQAKWTKKPLNKK